MTARLDHSIIQCSDKKRSAEFLADILSLPPPKAVFQFLTVELGNGVSLDYMERQGPITPNHYAFLVSDAEFDAGLARVRAAGLDWWADPGRQQVNEINRRWGGRGFYFDDPDGHLLELMTRSGTTS